MSAGPLNGVKVLDLSALLPGPYATTILADLGAEVTRVESPTRPDLIRALPPQVDGQSAVHLALNRGKRSVAIDLKRDEGRALALKLAEHADVLVEQFRPGVMARLGLDYDTLAALNPRLIYCSITGYGQHGPLAHRAGHDINYLALSGVASYSGRRGEGPRLSGVQIADLAGGSQPAVIAILAALFERISTGRGRHLDISMSDGALALNALTVAAASNPDYAPKLGGTFLNGGTLYDYYETRDGRALAVGSLEPQFVTQLFEALERPDLIREALRPPGEQATLKAELSALIKRETLEHWSALFATLDCCVEPVLTLDEALQHPHFEARGVVQRVELERGDSQATSSVTFVVTPLSRSFERSPQDQASTRDSSARLGARLGEDRELVFSELGLSRGEIEALKRDRVIG